MAGHKKDRKHAKEGGGVVAAVTKHANQFPRDKESPNGSSASLSPPQVQTPSSHGHPTASPFLDAVSAASFATSTSPGAKDWTKTMPPALAGSPGNLISLMGESPPTQPSSYEDPRAIPYGRPSPRAPPPSSHYLYHHHHHPPSSVSPPTSASRRPLSFQMDGHFSPPLPPPPPSHDHYPRAPLSAAAARRHSAQSSYNSLSPARAIPNPPPLPHQPQPHFYNLPDLNFDIQPSSGLKAGDRGYHFAFDTLPSSSFSSSSSPPPPPPPPAAAAVLGRDTVVLAGYEGGLEVHAVGKRGLDHVAGLRGLRGGVYHAKVLPWTVPGTPLFPLVVVVVHGPVLPPPPPAPSSSPSAAAAAAAAAAVAEGGDYDAVSLDRSEAIAGAGAANADAPSRDAARARHAAHAAHAAPGFVDAYQTSVEVYSLRTGRLVDVLLEAPRIPLTAPVTSPLFDAPPPSGALHVQADAGTVLVSSGETGECWLFRQMVAAAATAAAEPHQEQPCGKFVCLGKLWTTIPPPPPPSPRRETAAAEEERGRRRGSSSSPRPPHPRPPSAIVALRGRLLAYCPATPSSKISLRAAVRSLVAPRAPGLSSLTPPQLPPVNAEADLQMPEGVMNKIVRDAAQELIQSAKWVGQQSMQLLYHYWNPPTTPPARSPPQGAPPTARAAAAAAFAQRPEPAQFPPTHGPLSQPVAKDPGLISLLDLDALSGGPSFHPLATFVPPYGCSFLSLAPSGLHLFTASSKGDVQMVWDLKRLWHTKTSALQGAVVPYTTTTTTTTTAGGGGGGGALRFRQVAYFSRITVARVVDVAWTKPNGERIAVVTERGTAHLLDLPPSVFTWPPPRRRVLRPQDRRAAGSVDGGGGGAGGGGGGAASAASIASQALSSVRDVARPFMTRPRRSHSHVPQVTTTTTNTTTTNTSATTSTPSLVDHASHGGKVIAASISHSLGKTGSALSQLRNARDHRVSLPGSSRSAPGPSCVAWLTGRREHRLFVVGDGLVRTFPPKTMRRGDSSSSAAAAAARGAYRIYYPLARYQDFPVPSLPDDALAPRVRAYLDPDEYADDAADGDVELGDETMVLDTHVSRAPSRRRAAPVPDPSSIPQAEIETSAPYQPFHTDRRVALWEYGSGSDDDKGDDGDDDNGGNDDVADGTATGLSALLAGASLEEDVPPPAAAAVSRKKRGGAPAKKQARPASPRAPPPAATTTRPGDGDNGGDGGGLWVFGQPIEATMLDLGLPSAAEDEEEERFPLSDADEAGARPSSAVERVLHHVGADEEQIVVTTRRRRGGGRGGGGRHGASSGADGDEDDDGFFEDDCEVLDFADQRV